jgi:hypothetical protein
VTDDQLIEAIRAAFPPGDPLASDAVVPHSCEHCDEVAAALAGHAWPDLPAGAIDARHDALALLTPAAFRELLPAYMIRGLMRGPEEPTGVNDVLEFTVYSLLPDNASQWWLARVSGLSNAQAAIILKFLDHVAQQSDYFGEPPRESTAYWESRGRRTKG